MASIINPNNIDGTYPVAGQDNDSQGFRDNFTNTKTNFERARDEISDLQSKVVLKSALTGTVLDNNMNGARLSGVELLNNSETKLALGSRSGSVVINYATGSYQTVRTPEPPGAGTISLDFSNFSVPGTASRVRLQVTVTNTEYTLTLPAVVKVGVDVIQGLVGNVVTFNRKGVYEFEFVTNDQGATISVFDLSRNHDPIYLPSSEVISSGADVSLASTASTFSTDGSTKTATLAAGVPGQVKVLAMTAANGNMVISVDNAGWYATGTGTATFNAIGQACTLLYINSKWFCIGNNGAVFA